MPFFTNRGITPLPVGGGGSAWLLDQITPQPTGAYSTRKLKSSATQSIRLCDATGAVTQDIGFDGSDDLDTAAVSNFYTTNGNCANSRGYFDQSGNGNNFFSGTGSAVLIWSTVDSGAIQTMNSHAALLFTQTYGRPSIVSGFFASAVMTATAFTVIQTMRASLWGTNATVECGFLQDAANGYIGLNGPRNSTGIYSNLYDTGDKTVSRTGVIDTNYVVVSRLSGGTLSLWVNGGTPGTVSCGAIGDMAFHVMEMGTNSLGNGDVKVLDTLIYNTGLSNADINTLCSASGVTNGNIASRAGVTWTAI